MTTETAGWNPHYTSPAESTSFILSSMLEPLAATGEDLNAQPFLATSWTPNATFDSWTVVLREGVVFHNGEKLDAAAAKGSIEDGDQRRGVGPGRAGPLHGRLGRRRPHVEDRPDPAVGGVPEQLPRQPDRGDDRTGVVGQADHGSTHPVGTGPFVFDTWEPGTSLTVKKNPTYWQAGQPHLDQIEFKVIPDNGSRAAALQTGDLNMMMTTSASDATSLEGDYQVIKAWHTEPEMIAVNTSRDARRRDQSAVQPPRPEGAGLRHGSPGGGRCGR